MASTTVSGSSSTVVCLCYEFAHPREQESRLKSKDRLSQAFCDARDVVRQRLADGDVKIDRLCRFLTSNCDLLDRALCRADGQA